jgi:hypothetical protein
MTRNVFLACVLLVGGALGSAAYGSDDSQLRGIHRVFVEKMPNDLDQYISAEITKQLRGRLSVVLQKSDADGILRGTSAEQSGVGSQITGRYLGLHDTASGSISLIDRDERVVLWSSEAGDRSLWKGPMARGGSRKVAERLVHDLKDALGKGR